MLGGEVDGPTGAAGQRHEDGPVGASPVEDGEGVVGELFVEV